MKYKKIVLSSDLANIKEIAISSFASTPDSSLGEWFSFSVMQEMIVQSRGVCIKAVDEKNKIVGMIYAQQENPINGIEGTEKWVISIIAVKPELTGKGIGADLLKTIEKHAKKGNAKKMFVFTNKGDDQVVNFYKKNSYKDAGWIRNYQYGKDNSAVFLLKYI